METTDSLSIGAGAFIVPVTVTIAIGAGASIFPWVGSTYVNAAAHIAAVAALEISAGARIGELYDADAVSEHGPLYVFPVQRLTRADVPYHKKQQP